MQNIIVANNLVKIIIKASFTHFLVPQNDTLLSCTNGACCVRLQTLIKSKFEMSDGGIQAHGSWQG